MGKPNLGLLKAYIVAAVQDMKNNQDKQPSAPLIKIESDGEVLMQAGAALGYILWLEPSLRPFALKQLKANGLPTKLYERKTK